MSRERHNLGVDALSAHRTSIASVLVNHVGVWSDISRIECEKLFFRAAEDARCRTRSGTGKIKNMFLQQCTEDQRAPRQSGELRMISEKWSSSKKVQPGFWSLMDRGSEQVDNHREGGVNVSTVWGIFHPFYLVSFCHMPRQWCRIAADMRFGGHPEEREQQRPPTMAGRGARLPICFPVHVRASPRPRPSLPLGLLRV